MTENKAIEHSVNKFAVDVAKIWEDKAQIKALFAQNLTQQEFDLFVGLGMSLGANPFNREIWAVKYDKAKPAQIFTGRDFNRKKAQEQPDYGGHVSLTVYENDEFHYDVMTGMPHHKPSKLSERGKIVGAFALAWRKGIERPFYVWVDFKEYNKGFSLWKDSEKPATMIAKVAEDQVLRMAWQAKFAGTYGEAEQWQSQTQEAEKYKAAPPIVDKNNDVPQADYIEEEPETEGVDSMALRERLKNNFPQQNDRISFVQNCTGKVVKTVKEWEALNENDYSVISLALDKFEQGGE